MRAGAATGNASAALALVATLVLASLVGPAGADVIFPPSGPRAYRTRAPGDREEWQRWHVFAAGTMPIVLGPRYLVKWFSPRPGMSLGTRGPIQPWLDLDIEADFARLPFDPGGFDLGTPRNGGEAHLDWMMVAARIHADGEGWSPYAVVGIGLPGIDSPTIDYTDSQGRFQQSEASNLFAFDLGWELGGGLERSLPKRFALFADIRLVSFPGRTEPTHSAIPLRAGLAAPLPFGW